MLQTNTPDLQKCGVRYDLLHILYAAMLLNFSPEQIRRFWNKNPLPGYDHSNELSMFTDLWQGHGWYPSDYVFQVLDSLESFLVENDKTILNFIHNSFHRINRGLLIPPRDWLIWSKPFLEALFIEPDVRYLILTILNHYTSMIKPGIQYKVVKHTTENEINRTVMLATSSQVYFNLPIFDCEIWSAYLIKGVPASLNCPIYENHFMLADRRNISDILKNVTYDDSCVFFDNKKLATKILFNSFCDQCGIAIDGVMFPDISVWIALEDIYCPDRNRTVIHKGCAYGTPVYLFGYNYKSHSIVPGEFLGPLIDDIALFNDHLWAEIKDLHTNLISQLTSKASFVYDKKHDTIQLNGIYIIKNVPAKILRKILIIYTQTGRTEFQHAEFVKDEFIIENPFNPNFVVRLQRLMQTLIQCNKEIIIKKIDKGRFVLSTSCKIEFQEIN
jgi:hypothetical protein